MTVIPSSGVASSLSQSLAKNDGHPVELYELYIFAGMVSWECSNIRSRVASVVGVVGVASAVGVARVVRVARVVGVVGVVGVVRAGNGRGKLDHYYGPDIAMLVLRRVGHGAAQKYELQSLELPCLKKAKFATGWCSMIY